MGARPSGVAGEVALVKYGRNVRPVESTPGLTTAASQIVKNSADRVELLIQNVGTDVIAFGVNKSLTLTTGVRLPPGGTAVVLADEDGDMVGYEFWGIANSGTQSLYVIEFVADV